MRKCPRKRPFTRAEKAVKSRIYRNEYRFAHKDKINADRREKYGNNSEHIKEIARKSRYLNLYGITIEKAEEMLKNQNNKCAICKKEISFEGRYGACVDHNNIGVRGILCSHCNKGLGHFIDNINNLLNAINYLKKKKFILIVSPFKKAS